MNFVQTICWSAVAGFFLATVIVTILIIKSEKETSYTDDGEYTSVD